MAETFVRSGIGFRPALQGNGFNTTAVGSIEWFQQQMLAGLKTLYAGIKSLTHNIDRLRVNLQENLGERWLTVRGGRIKNAPSDEKARCTGIFLVFK